MALLLQSGRAGWRHLVAPGSAISGSCSSAIRDYSAAPPPKPSDAEDDVVLTSFKKSQQHYRAFMEGMKKINIPLNGDEGAIKKYAKEVEALKQKIGMDSIGEILGATLDHEMSMAGNNVRKFLMAAQARLAAEGVELGPYQAVCQEISKAVDDVERETGSPLEPGSDKGWGSFQNKIEAIQKQHGLDDYEKIKDQAILDMYKNQLQQVRQKAIDDMDVIKRRDGLEFINVDPATLNPKA